MSYERYIDWLDEAFDDYATAQDLYKLERYSKACFFSHQACEKALKALIMKLLGLYVSIHSVKGLLQKLTTKTGVPNHLFEYAEYLDKLYIPTRYPNAWPSGAPYKHYNRNDAELALKYASEVLKFVKEKIKENT